jgi:hypothetical protein
VGRTGARRDMRAAPAWLSALCCANAMAAGACRKDPIVTDRAVTLHVPQACAADGGAYAEYEALGDFEPAPAASGHLLSGVGGALPEIDSAARALVVQADESDREWLGEGDVPALGDVDILLLPSLSSCPLTAPVGPRDSPTLGAVADPDVLVVGGGSGTSTPGTYVAHLDTGEVEAVPPYQDLLTPRTRASVTPFGEGGLVAGGVDPRSGSLLATAEVYSSALGGFAQQQPVALSEARADHGAVVLATGETLLVGGVGASGDVLGSMELVDPVTRQVRAEDVAQLAVARRNPTVLRLASGEILVAGGLDSSGAAVSAIEWLASDASQSSKLPRDLVAGSARAYAALGAGGALAVIAPPSNAPADFQNVWVIDADGAFEPATPIAGSIAQPVLFGGAGGAPVLWTGGAAGRWLRWQPWSGAFGPLDVLDDRPAQIGAATASAETGLADTGLALWLDASTQKVTGLRFDVRGSYSGLSGPLLVADASDMAPDRLVASGVVTFDPTVGLDLAPGASAFVTDRTYADVDVAVDAPTGEPALVVLRDTLGNELEAGGAACPGAIVAGSSASSLAVTRRGATVTWSLSGGVTHTCPTTVFEPDARLSVGVRGAPDLTRSVARNLRVTRVGQP